MLARRWVAAAAGAQRAAASPLHFCRHASKKAGAAASDKKGTRIPKHRGVKVCGQSFVPQGKILVRQVGSTFHAGRGVARGKDFSLNALRPGIVVFSKVYLGEHHIGGGHRARYRKFVHVVDPEEALHASKVKHLARCRSDNKARAVIRPQDVVEVAATV